MINKFDFNLIVSLMENNFFLKKKKNLRFIKKLVMNFNHRKVLIDIIYKIKPHWNIFVRLESLFGFLPKINVLTTRRKTKLKKIIFLRSFWVFKSFLTNERKIMQILSYIFDFHNYMYLNFIINKKMKVDKYTEVFRHFVKKNLFIQHNSLMFQNNIFFRWLDLSRKFINIQGPSLRIFNTRLKFYDDFKRLRSYRCKFAIESFYFKFFLKFLKTLFKNYRKLVLFLFKKNRKRKKIIEKAYILL